MTAEGIRRACIDVVATAHAREELTSRLGGHLMGAITEVDGKVLAKVLNAKASDDALPA